MSECTQKDMLLPLISATHPEEAKMIFERVFSDDLHYIWPPRCIDKDYTTNHSEKMRRCVVNADKMRRRTKKEILMPKSVADALIQKTNPNISDNTKQKVYAYCALEFFKSNFCGRVCLSAMYGYKDDLDTRILPELQAI
eukprot:405353_1